MISGINEEVYVEKWARFQEMDTDEQKKHRSDIIELFREFWTGVRPSEELFASCIGSVVIFTEIMYIMVTA